MPADFILHKPILSTITNIDARQLAKSTNRAIICLAASNSSKTVEIINTKNGKLLGNDKQSIVCKSELFEKWCRVYHLLYGQNEITLKNDAQKFVYSDVKTAAVDYQLAKKCLYKAFKQSNLGCWLKKPFEQDHFEFNPNTKIEFNENFSCDQAN